MESVIPPTWFYQRLH